MRYRTGIGAAAVALLAWAGAASGQTAPPKPDADYLPYLKPQILAEVAPGRKIHLICMGEGSPTVILTAGLGNWAEIWRKVQPAIARKTRVCGWDRPGYGFSSPSPEPQDTAHTTADLEAALKVAGIRGPYILVGHSLGGYESLWFADRHPREVVGMVLVDPSFPDQHRAMEGVSPEASKFEDSFMAAGVIGLKGCASALRAGTLKAGDPVMTRCLQGDPAFPPALTESLHAVDLEPARYETQASLVDRFAADSAMVVDPHRNYGQMPLIVLTAGQVQALPPEMHVPPVMVAALAEFQHTTWPRAHDALAALSTHGRNVMVPDSSHYIQTLKPQLVIESVDSVIDAARGSGR